MFFFSFALLFAYTIKLVFVVVMREGGEKPQRKEDGFLLLEQQNRKYEIISQCENTYQAAVLQNDFAG